MANNNIMVYVFKTSVKTKKIAQQLTLELNQLLPDEKWNFDLEDCDNIFRIESSSEETKDLILNFLKEKGFFCEELI